MRAQFTTYAVPGWGVGELWTGEGVVLAHEFRYGAELTAVAAAVSKTAPPKGATAPLSSTVPGKSQQVGDGFVPTSQLLDPGGLTARFKAFFAGEPTDFTDVPIDLDWATSFQRALADALRTIPRGAIVSYGELAALAGRPGAARAAGTFCARNRFMLILPCHRVVGADGLGGYGSAGLSTKRRLLALEGVAV